MTRVLASTLLVALLAVESAAQSQNCFEKYQCVFHHDIQGQEYSWDLHQLCIDDGQYNYSTPADGHTTYFNICGNATTICAPGYPTYDTHGVAIQIDSSAFPPVCTVPNCTDYDYQVPVCCTEPCTILGTEFFQFYLQDNSNPSKGVTLVHAGMPPDPLNPFACPDGPSGLPIDRQLVINITCDQTVPSNQFVVDSLTEPSTCLYVISGRSAAGCGVANDPFDCPSNSASVSSSVTPAPSGSPSRTARPTPSQTQTPSRWPVAPAGQNSNTIPAGYISGGGAFGVAVASSVLTVGLMFLYTFGETRGWWDPIKRRLPTFGSKSAYTAGSIGTKTAYSTVGVTSSAYGT